MASDEIDQLAVSNGTVRVGDPVSAATPEGHVVEGNVFALQPYGHREVDPTWSEKGTVIIEDCETKTRSHWRPSRVTKLN